MWALVGWASLLGPAAVLEAQPLDRPETAFTGTVVTSDAFKLVMRADNGKLVTFPVQDPWTVPAGLVAGTRVTARYELVDDAGYRLVGVKIASGPIEPGSTTEPPPVGPAPPSAPDGLRKQPGTSPVLPQPESARPTPEPSAEPPPEPAHDDVAPPAAVAAAQRSGPQATPRLPEPRLPPAAASPPGTRELATLFTLLLVSSALLWAAFARS